MTREEFKTYQTLTEKFSEYCDSIFSYIKKNYIDVLKFGKYSAFSHTNLEDNNIIELEYYDCGYDCYDYDTIKIPIDDFFNDPYKWIDKWTKEIIAKKEATRQRLNEIAEQKERDEYERLKKKFEK